MVLQLQLSGAWLRARRYRSVWRVKQRVQGAEDEDTLLTASSLADTLAGQGKHAEAVRLYRETLSVQKRVLGEDHEITLYTTGSLASRSAAWPCCCRGCARPAAAHRACPA